MFDRLYFKNGTFYVVTDDPTSVPPLNLIISSGIPLTSGYTDDQKRLPTEKDMQIIELNEAKQILGERALRLDGITVSPGLYGQCVIKLTLVQWLANDPKQL